MKLRVGPACSFVPQTPPIAPPRPPIANGHNATNAHPSIEYEASQPNGIAQVTPESPDQNGAEKGSARSSASFTLGKLSGGKVISSLPCVLMLQNKALSI